MVDMAMAEIHFVNLHGTGFGCNGQTILHYSWLRKNFTLTRTALVSSPVSLIIAYMSFCCKIVLTSALFLPLDEVVASRMVFVLISGSDGWKR